MLRLLVFLFLVSVQSLCVASIPGYTIERAYYHGADPQTAIDAITQAPFIPFAGDLHLGLQQGPTWVRFRITHDDPSGQRAVAGPGNPFILRVGPYTLDQVDLYERIHGQWVVSRAGDRQVQSFRRCPDDMHCFSLQTYGQAPSTVYARIQTPGMRLIETELTLEDILALSVAPRIGRISTSLALACGLLVLGLLFLLVQRTRLLYLYCLHQSTVLLLLFASSGRLAMADLGLSPGLLDSVTNAAHIARIATMVALGWAVVQKHQPAPTFSLLTIALLALCGVAGFLVGFGYTHAALVLAYGVLAVNPLVQLFGAFKISASARELKNTVLCSYAVYLFFLVLSSSVAFGLLQGSGLDGVLQNLSDWRLNGVAVGLFVLLVVNDEQAAGKLQALQELQALRMQALQASSEREILRERNTLIDMLTHELKTPLGTVRFALASLRRDLQAMPQSLHRVRHIDASVTRMNTIIEHVATSVQFEHVDTPLALSSVAAAPVIAEVVQECPCPERFVLDVPEDATLRTDRTLLLLVVENLVSNACKYAAPGEIHIALRSDAASGGNLEIRNRVDPDMAPDPQRLFDRYYRHPKAIGQPGVGIGLHLVQAGALRLGATVHYRQEHDWAVFEVQFPA